MLESKLDRIESVLRKHIDSTISKLESKLDRIESSPFAYSISFLVELESKLDRIESYHGIGIVSQSISVRIKT